MKIIMENYNGDHKTSKELSLNAQKLKTHSALPPPKKTAKCHPYGPIVFDNRMPSTSYSDKSREKLSERAILLINPLTDGVNTCS